MPRLEIELPERFRFASELCMYAGHVNLGGHLDNAQLLILYSEVRRRFFAELGCSEENLEGLRTMLTDAAVIYVSEAFVGEVLVFQVATRDFNRYGCDLVWLAREKLTGREVARGKSGFVFVDSATRRPAPVPPSFKDRSSAPGITAC